MFDVVGEVSSDFWSILTNKHISVKQTETDVTDILMTSLYLFCNQYMFPISLDKSAFYMYLKFMQVPPK